MEPNRKAGAPAECPGKQMHMNTDWHVRSNGLGFIIMDQDTNIVAECKEQAMAQHIVRLHQASDVPNHAAFSKGRPEILPVEHVRLFLKRGIDPVTAPGTLLQLFAAHRPCEARNQEWEHIKPGSPILIWSDLNRWREIPFHDVLIPWLTPYLGKVEGLMEPKPLLSSRKLARAAGELGLRFEPKAWCETYAAYRFAITRSRPLVAHEMGIEDTVFVQHFCRPTAAVPEAEAFFALTPEASGRGNWADEVAAALAR